MLRGLHTQADAVLLQQDPKVALGSLQKIAEGLSIVTDVKRQKEAVTEPKQHAPRCPGHSLMAAEACKECHQARAVFSPPPSSLRIPPAPFLTRVHKFVHVTKGVEGCVVGGVDPGRGLALGEQGQVTGLRGEAGEGESTASYSTGTLSRIIATGMR